MTYRTRRPARIIPLAVLLASCATAESPPASLTSLGPSPTSSAVEASASPPEPTSTPLPLELTWSAEDFQGNVAALTEDRGSLVAVGRDANGRDGLAAWTSGNGADWERHSVPDPTFIDNDMVNMFGQQIYDGSRMGPLTRLGDTLFSMGNFFGFNDFYRPLGYGSADGTEWEFIESESDFYQYGAVGDAETFQGGLLATRATGLAGPNYDLWTWAPGDSWQKTSIQSALGASLIRLDAAPVGDEVVVVGQVAEHDALPNLGENHPVAWVSSDVSQWDELDLPPGMASACGVDQTPAGDGFTVMGTRPNGDVAVWTTSDRATWARSDLAPGACGDFPVTLAGPWLVASISTGNEGAKVWLSPDGLEWVQQDIPPIQSVAVAELDGQLHILGTPTDERPFTSVLLHGIP